MKSTLGFLSVFVGAMLFMFATSDQLTLWQGLFIGLMAFITSLSGAYLLDWLDREDKVTEHDHRDE